MPLSGWWAITKRTYANLNTHNLQLVSAGVAFYFLLAVFPLLTAVISLYGLLVSFDDLQSHMSYLINVVPADSRYILEEQLQGLISKSDKTLGWGFALSVLVALWSSSKGANALITACNITYHESTKRRFMFAIIARMMLTLAIIGMIILALLIITVMPQLLNYLLGKGLGKLAVGGVTWLVLVILFNVGLSSLYRYGPHRTRAKWRWVTPGALFATILWVAFSYAFSYYLQTFATFNKTYGSVVGIVILLIWFYTSALIILMGAELNSSLELQTEKDSTHGKDKPLGERGAFVADHTPDNRPPYSR
ncbi:ribonuclease [Alteromonas halophila]|uniref:Ribonuclease n=2 Tax=Alteromonas halophila TaxID=516698 RepID=A0A918JQ81_9ALTE|nr:ribonuclease [Alteromonas halophila]